MKTLLPRLLHKPRAVAAASRRQTRALLCPLACVLACATAHTAAALTPEDWEFRQVVEIHQPGRVRVPVPLETVGTVAPGFKDLRVIGPDGSEVPFALLRTQPRPPSWAMPRSVDVSLTQTATLVTVDAGKPSAWQSVHLESATPRFLKPVQLEVSQDGTAWTRIAADLPIYREGSAEQLVIPLGLEAVRWIRLAIDDTRTAPVVVTGARLEEARAGDGGHEQVQATVVRTERFAEHTEMEVRLPVRNLDVSGIELSVSDALFSRPVETTYRTSRDGEVTARSLGRDLIFRTGTADETEHKLTVGVDASIPVQELLLQIQDGDSPPLTVTGVSVSRRIVSVAFHASGPGQYTFLSGNPVAAEPRYDVSHLSRSLSDVPVQRLPVGPQVRTPAYQRRDPFEGIPALGAELEAAKWSHQRRVEVSSPGVQQLELDLAALTHAHPNLGDIRLVQDSRQVPYVLERSTLTRSQELQAVLVPLPQRPTVTRWRVDLPYTGAAITSVKLESPTPLFERHLRVVERRTGPNGTEYEAPLGDAPWRQASTPGKPLVLAIARPATQVIWLETDNGDNPPIALGRLTASHPVTRMIFRVEQAEPLALLAGHRAISAPRYDLALLADKLLAAEKHVARLADAVQVEGVSDQNRVTPYLLWAALALVVGVLLFAIAKLLPKPPPEV